MHKRALLFCLLACLFLTPAYASGADREDMLPLFPLVCRAGLSHVIPVTYNLQDDEAREAKAVQVSDGYWVAFVKYSTVNDNRKLFLMKLNLDGRTMIPPFFIGYLTRTDNVDFLYRFCLVPLDTGGVEVLTTEISGPVGSSDPAYLKQYRYDAQGRTTMNRVAFVEFDTLTKQLKDLWAARTNDGRTVWVARGDSSLHWGVLTDGAMGQSWAILPTDFSSDTIMNYNAAAYDPSTNRLFVYYSRTYTPMAYLERWNLDGTRECQVDILSDLGAYSHLNPPGLMITSRGIMLTLPYDNANLGLLFFNQNCQKTAGATVAGLVVDPGIETRHHMLLDAQERVRIAYPHDDHCYYAIFDLYGGLNANPWDVAPSGYNHIVKHVHAFLNGSRVTFFYSHDPSSAVYRHLVCRHLGYSFPGGFPDLVVSIPHITQSPDYALLNSQVAIRAKVYNRGEADSTAATLRLVYQGTTYQGAVPGLVPGQGYTVEFNPLPTPVYLSSQPTLAFSLVDNQFAGNNQIDATVRYPGRTPIYPPGSALYTWTVRDKSTLAALQYVECWTTLTGVQTVDGGSQNVAVTFNTDAAGQFTSRLPAGAYAINMFKTGYPPTEVSVTVPNPASNYLELEPPGDLSLTLGDTLGGGLHPTPNPVYIVLNHQTLDYGYAGRGDDNGLTLTDLMPGSYDYTLSAFGYSDKTGALTITGGTTNPYTMNMVATSRGQITGNVYSGGSPLNGASVDILGTGQGVVTVTGGSFTITDLPYGTYKVAASKDGYSSATAPVTLSGALAGAGTLTLNAVSAEQDDLGHWTVTAWNRVEEVPGTFFTSNYKVSVTYGVFDMDGQVNYVLTGSQASFGNITLNVNGWKWYYYSVSTSFSLLDIAFSGLDQIIDGVGDLVSGLVDAYDGGFFDFLEGNIGAGGSGGQTIVRIDRVAVYEAGVKVWDSWDDLLQHYSTDGPLVWPMGGTVDDITQTTIRVYCRVTNENFSIGPLYLLDKMMLEWRYDGTAFKLDKFVQNPPGYPTVPN